VEWRYWKKAATGNRCGKPIRQRPVETRDGQLVSR